MAEDHLLYGPEREQFKHLMDPQNHKDKNRHKTSNSHSSLSKHDSADMENSLPVTYLEHTPGSNSQQPHQSNELHLEHTPSSNSWQPETVPMPSQVYGAEHLLRLFLKFPLFLSRAQLPLSHIQLLHQYFKDLLSYLCNRRTELFLEENYYDVGPSGEQGDIAQRERGEEEGEQALSASTTS